MLLPRERSRTLSLADLRSTNGADFQVFEELVRFESTGTRVTAEEYERGQERE